MAGAGGVEVGRISVRVVPDLAGFRRTLKTNLDAVERTAEVDVGVNADTSHVRQQIKAATEGITTKVSVEVDRSALSRVADQLGTVTAPQQKLPVPQVGGFGAAGAGIAGLGAVLAVAGPALGLLTAALATLPGLLAAVVAPVGAITLGLDGIKKAAEVLKTPFENLKTVMNGANETAFAPVFEKLKGVFPTLEAALPRVSQGLADMLDGAVSAVTGPEGLALIKTTIENIGAAFTKAKPGVSGFTTGLLGLAEQFSQKLPGLSEWINSVGESFAGWVEKVSADGSLSTAFDGLGATLKSIGDAVVPLLGQSLDFFKDPDAIKNIQSAADLIGKLGSVVITASNALAGMASPVTIAYELIGSLGGVFDRVKATAANAMGAVVASVASVGSQIAGAWNGVVAAAQSAWNTVVSTVSSAISSAVAAVVSGGARILSEVASWPGKIAGAVGSLGGVLVSAGRALMDGLLSGIRSGLNAVLDFAKGIADKIAAVKGPLPYDLKVLTPAGEAMMHGLDAGLQNGFTSVLDRAQNMASQLTDVLGPQNLQKEWSRADLAAIPGAGGGKDPSEYAKTAAQIPVDFIERNVGQFTQDLGIGGGALSAAAEQGFGFVNQLLSGLITNGLKGSGTTIQVNSVDEAVAAERSVTAKRALQYYRR